MQQTKWRARPASCEADAANFTFRCTVPSLDETVTYDTYVLNFNNCPPAMKVVSGLAAEQSPPLGGWASPPDDLTIETQPLRSGGHPVGVKCLYNGFFQASDDILTC